MLARSPDTAPPACALGPLAVSDLRFALRAGTPPPGFGARSTIAQALAAACGRARSTRPSAQAVAPPGAARAVAPTAAVSAVPAASRRATQIVCPIAAPAVCPAPA